MGTITVTLPDEQHSFVQRLVSSGKFHSADECVRSLVTEAQARSEREKLEELLIEGLDSTDEFEDTLETQAERYVKLKQMLAGPKE